MKTAMLPATHPCGARVLLDLPRRRWVDPTTHRQHVCGVEPVVLMTEDDPRHGTRNGYGNLGCRCRPCTDAHAAYTRNQKAKRRGA